MAYENSAGIGVFNQYGPRNSGNAIGDQQTSSYVHELTIDLTGDMLNATVSPTIFVPKVKAKKGWHFRKATLRVDEVFVVTGTTPTIEIGSEGSTATNGFVITEAELEALGTKQLASAGVGTWAFTSATGVAADANVAIAREGDTAVAAGSGKATLVLEYVYNTKV